MISADGQEPGIFALTAGIGLKGDRIEAGDLGEPGLQVLEQSLVTLGLLSRHEGVDVGKTGPGYGDHLGAGIQLHGAGAEGDHGAVQRQVLELQAPEIAQHFRLAAVTGEDGVVEKAVLSALLRQQGGGRLAIELVGTGGIVSEDGKQGFDGGVVGGFIAGDAKPVLIHQAQIDAGCQRLGEDRFRLARQAHRDGVEEMPGLDRDPAPAQALRQNFGVTMGAPRNAPKPAPAVINGEEGSDDRQQHLGGADIAGRLFPADMLFAGLQRHAQRLPAGGIDGNPDQPSRHGALIGLAGGEEGGMRTAIAHGHAEALRTADGDIRAHFAGRVQDHQRQQVGGDNRKSARRFQRRHRFGEITHLAAGARIVEQGGKHAGRIEVGHRIAGDDLETEGLGAGFEDGEGLGMTVGIDEKTIGLRLGDALGHGHRFRRRRALVQERGVRDIEAGEITDRLLEVQQHFEPPLADLGLIGGVGSVPARIFQDIAQDHRGRDRAVIAHADHRGFLLVRVGQALQIVEHLALGPGRRKVECSLGSDRRRGHLVDEVIQ